MLGDEMQAAGRTSIQSGGREWTFFGGCDYLRLSTHPEMLDAAQRALGDFGMTVSASRVTTGNHPLYRQLESSLSKFISAPAALLTSSGYTSNFVAAQALHGRFARALIDERAHPSLRDASRFLGAEVVPFQHLDTSDLADRVSGGADPVLLLTDGLFAHSGAVPPLGEYLRALPAGSILLVDDAHAAGVVGARGQGTVESQNLPRNRIVQTMTLSKAFGAFGGAVLGPADLITHAAEKAGSFVGSTPIPLPSAAAALKAIELIQSDLTLLHRLRVNVAKVQAASERNGHAIPGGEIPFFCITPADLRETELLKQRLLAAGIFPPHIHYPGGPAGGFFRFVLSSEHTSDEIDRLIAAIGWV